MLKSLALSWWDHPRMEELKRSQRGVLVVLGGMLVFQVLAYLETWSQHGWVSWLFMIGLRVELLVLIAALRKRQPQWRQLGTGALTLPTLAEAEDEQRAPLAAEQPIPLPADELLPGPTQCGPLRRQRVLLLVTLVLSILLICLPPGFFAFFLLSMSSWFSAAQTLWFTVVLGLLIACMMLPLASGGIQGIQLTRRRAQAASVLADDQGLHGQHPHSPRRNQL